MEDSDYLIASSKKEPSRSYGYSSYIVVAVCSLLLGVLVSVTVLKNQKPYLYVNSNEFGHFRAISEPPPHQEVARVARYVMHSSDWCSLSTISTHEGIEGYPFVNVISISDGPLNNSTGIPYFYMTELDISAKDLKKDNRASITLTEAESGYCEKKGYDPQSPLCARIILIGKIVQIEKGSLEESFARESLFSRHPEMSEWPTDHNWYFAKLNVTHIYVLDYFGGINVVTPADYFNANSA